MPDFEFFLLIFEEYYYLFQMLMLLIRRRHSDSSQYLIAQAVSKFIFRTIGHFFFFFRNHVCEPSQVRELGNRTR